MEIKRPLVWMLAAYLAGLSVYSLAASFMAAAGAAAFLGILLLLLSADRSRRLRNYSFLLLLPLLFGAGYLQMNRQLSDNTGDFITEQKEKGAAEGRISLVEETDSYIRITLKDAVLVTEEGRTAGQLKLLLYAKEGETYLTGNRIKASGSIIQFTRATNPGQFDEYLYYKTKQYDYKFYADSINITDSNTNSYYQTLYTIKNKLTGTYYRLLSEKNAGILTAMMLGDTNYLDEDIKELYRVNGISHILAISGLHISLLGLTLYRIFCRLRLPVFLSTALTLFFLYSYGILTGFGVSTNRAVVMMSIYMAAVLAGRTYDLLSGTALSALIILVQSPLEITSAGFLLSFGAVLGIGTVYPALAKVFLKEKGDKGSRKPLAGILQETLLASTGIQLILLPVLLWFFYEIPVYSPFINLLIIPISSFLTIMAFGAVLAGCIWIPAGAFLMGSVNYILEFYEGVCRLGAKLPGKSLLTGKPEVPVVLFYLLMLFFFVRINSGKGKKASLLLLLSMLFLLLPARGHNLEVTFLDVGQGDGIFLRLPDGTTMLVDGGSSTVKKVGQYRLEPFLKYRGVGSIDYALVTHGDGDHYSGILELLEDSREKIRIKNLLLPGVSLQEEAYRKLIQAAEEKGIAVSVLNTGDSLQAGDVSIECLWPDKPALKSGGENDGINGHSVVLSLHYGEFDLLLTGDLEGTGEVLITGRMAEGEVPHRYDILNKRVTRLIQFRFSCSSL